MNTSENYLSRRSARAFTLVEILVASSVMVILVGIVAYITGSVMNSWNRSSGKLSANAEARLALDLLTQDLETAVLRNNGQQWLRVEDTVPGDIGGPYSSDSVNLKLFTLALDRQAGDGICAVAYKLAYQPSYPGGPNIYALYRMVVNPQETLNDYLSSGFDDPDSSAQGTLTGVAPDWSNGTITNDSNYLVSNIVEFKILIYDSSQTEPRNADVNYNITQDYRFGGSDSNAGTNMPLYADIILTTVTDQGTTLLNNIAQGLVPFDANDVVTQNGETLIRRVYFKSGPI
jgi:type II secretory pathway pseudopilin PulG